MGDHLQNKYIELWKVRTKEQRVARASGRAAGLQSAGAGEGGGRGSQRLRDASRSMGCAEPNYTPTPHPSAPPPSRPSWRSVRSELKFITRAAPHRPRLPTPPRPLDFLCFHTPVIRCHRFRWDVPGCWLSASLSRVCYSDAFATTHPISLSHSTYLSFLSSLSCLRKLYPRYFFVADASNLHFLEHRDFYRNHVLVPAIGARRHCYFHQVLVLPPLPRHGGVLHILIPGHIPVSTISLTSKLCWTAQPYSTHISVCLVG